MNINQPHRDIEINPLKSKKYIDSEEEINVSVEESVNIINISLEEQDKKNVILYKNNKKEFIKILRSLPNLTPQQIRIIEVRYLDVINKYKYRIYYIDFLYHFSRGFISIGSVLVPALLSIQVPSSANSVLLYWLTWGISITVTILHNILTIFRFDKKYFGIHSTLEKLESEGWHYLELSGRYNHYYNHHPTHQNQFNHFTNTIEKLKMSQIDEEYNSISSNKLSNVNIPNNNSIITNDEIKINDKNKSSPNSSNI
jgi:hypothetical protein